MGESRSVPRGAPPIPGRSGAERANHPKPVRQCGAAASLYSDGTDSSEVVPGAACFGNERSNPGDDFVHIADAAGFSHPESRFENALSSSNSMGDGIERIKAQIGERAFESDLFSGDMLHRGQLWRSPSPANSSGMATSRIIAGRIGFRARGSLQHHSRFAPGIDAPFP